MKEGRILQVGSPIELYNRPAERFVAAFIGSPAMNFIDGEIKAGSGEIVTQFTGIPVPQRFERALAGFSGGRIVVGLRPEDIHLVKPEGSSSSFHEIKAVIDVFEPLGNEIIFHLKCGDQNLVVRESAERKGSPGMQVEAHLDLGRMHLFEHDSGTALKSD